MDLGQGCGWICSSRRFVYGTARIAAPTELEPPPAMVAHFMGGNVARPWFEGYLLGLARPIIGRDLLAWIGAVGLLAALYQPGFSRPLVTVRAEMIGSTHSAQFAIAGAEL